MRKAIRDGRLITTYLLFLTSLNSQMLKVVCVVPPVKGYVTALGASGM